MRHWGPGKGTPPPWLQAQVAEAKGKAVVAALFEDFAVEPTCTLHSGVMDETQARVLNRLHRMEGRYEAAIRYPTKGAACVFGVWV